MNFCFVRNSHFFVSLPTCYLSVSQSFGSDLAGVFPITSRHLFDTHRSGNRVDSINEKKIRVK